MTPRCLFVCLTLVLLGGTASLNGAEPAPSALRLLPPDAGLTLVVQDLRTHSRKLTASPIWKTLQSAAFRSTALGGIDLAPLEQLEPVLKTLLGTSAEELRDDIFGDLVAFAYVPANDQAQQPEATLLLIVPRKLDRLEALATRLNELQVQSGELKEVRTKSHAGQGYSERVKPDDGGTSDFYAVVNGAFVFCSQEHLLKAVLERQQKPPASHPLLRELAEFTTPPLLLGTLNPRSLDADLANQLAQSQAKPDDAAFLQQFHKFWAATDRLSLVLQAREELQLDLRGSFTEARLPSELKPLFKQDLAPRSGWLLPQSPLFALQGQTNLKTLLPALESFAPPVDVPILDRLARDLGPVVGKDRFAPLLAQFGSRWALWADAPQPGRSGGRPEWTIAVEVGDASPLPMELTRGLQQLLDHTAHQLRVKWNKAGPEEWDLLEEARGPRGVKHLRPSPFTAETPNPAYGLIGNQLIIASSPERVLNFQPLAPAAEPVPLFRLDAAQARAYLKTSREALAKTLARWQGRDTSSLSNELETLETLLEPLKSLELWHRRAGDRHGLNLILKLQEPLK